MSEAQRQQLARGIVPRVTDHLDRCLESVAQRWPARGADADTSEWANQLRSYQFVLRRQFEEALERDFLSATYPPAYDFSGSAYAGDDSGLQILDDYQSTRRSLRHQLEGLIREHNRYSYYVFVQAAREDDRFEHPGWAPWSPLNWYERLIESAEEQFGRTDMTLSLMRGYVQCLGKTAAPALAFVVETVEACGLVREPVSEAPDGDLSRAPARPSWGDTRADNGEPEAQTPADAASADPALLAGPDGAAAGGAVAGGGGRARMPAADAGPEAWQRWAATAGWLPGDGGVVPAESGAAPAGAPSLAAVIEGILAGVLAEVSQQLLCHAEFRGLMQSLPPLLARAVSRDLEFFHDPAHPLRQFAGSLVNTGVRISPGVKIEDSEAVKRYLLAMRAAIQRLANEADTIDRAGAEDLYASWEAARAAEDTNWWEGAQERAAPMMQQERAARARRSLTVCVLETGAELPERAAEQIADAWEDLLAVDEAAQQVLESEVQEVARAICNRATPQEVNPLVQRIVGTAREFGADDDRIKAVVQHLGQAHLQRIRATGNEPRFDPQARIQARRTLRLEDDDRDLLTDLDDRFVFDASRIRRGDWFECVDKASGESWRVGLVWRGEATRGFLFLSLDQGRCRRHSLQGVAQELREGRMRPLPVDNPLDALLG
ncbi:DUF1631 family protein [Thioalkalivibrio sp. ALJ16]|uniref:DUF1631 family protein n=1 Tax=Thioalkalivibrio sp. ALJ16 TaxID=1158762 RepID=UPI000475C0F9|nr:DUF1631 family protein [Thioalkalivibrio sp. ALJ16]